MEGLNTLGKSAGAVIAICAALALLVGYVVQLYNMVLMVRRHDKEVQDSKEERKLMLTTLLAICRRLKETGANGTVSGAIASLETYLVDKAHD